MRIDVLEVPLANIIAREIQVQGSGGNFHLRLSGHVAYRSPEDGKEWPAGQSIESFVAAAEAWNSCNDDVLNAVTDQEERAVVDRLRKRLNDLDVLLETEDGFWDLALIQAQDGLL